MSSVYVPNTLSKALSYDGWRLAIQEELDIAHKNHTWILVHFPQARRQSDGTVNRLKAQLVGKDYAKTYGINYYETFSLVSKLNLELLLQKK